MRAAGVGHGLEPVNQGKTLIFMAEALRGGGEGGVGGVGGEGGEGGVGGVGGEGGEGGEVGGGWAWTGAPKNIAFHGRWGR